jgi:hypothetical protein
MHVLRATVNVQATKRPRRSTSSKLSNTTKPSLSAVSITNGLFRDHVQPHRAVTSASSSRS